MKNKLVSAFAPGSLSCFFVIHDNPDPRWKGSTGCGFTVDKGVTVTAAKADKTEVIFNSERTVLSSVDYVLRELQIPDVFVEIKTELPLSSGFGLSGASALATAYAVNELFELRKTEKELAIFAHKADVVSGTGLGDVANQFLGGFNIKLVPSSHFTLEKLPLNNSPVYIRNFSKLLTSSVISDKNARELINKAGNEALEKVKNLRDTNAITFKDIITISKTFAIESRLLKDERVKQMIGEIEKKGGHASMIMLGNSVFSDIPFDGATRLVITNVPAHLL
jgi:pantoate kinase